MASRARTFAVALCAAFLFLPCCLAKSVKDFEAMPIADQGEYVASFVDKMITDVRQKRPELADQIHDFFYKDQVDRPRSEGVEKVGLELITLDTLAKRGKIDLSKVEIEQVIVYVTKRKFPPPPPMQ